MRLKGRKEYCECTYAKMFALLKPGGFAKVHDISYFHRRESTTWDVVSNLLGSCRLFGNEGGGGIKVAMVNSGFIQVQETRVSTVSSDTKIRTDIIKGLLQDVCTIFQQNKVAKNKIKQRELAAGRCTSLSLCKV